jgi:hypothetical protein
MIKHFSRLRVVWVSQGIKLVRMLGEVPGFDDNAIAENWDGGDKEGWILEGAVAIAGCHLHDKELEFIELATEALEFGGGDEGLSLRH